MANPIDCRQPSLTVTEAIALEGIYPARDSFNDGMTMGMFHTYGFGLGMDGAPAATGQILAISSNTSMFSLIGTLYGGNGVSTFALPGLGGRTAVSMGQGTATCTLVMAVVHFLKVNGGFIQVTPTKTDGGNWGGETKTLGVMSAHFLDRHLRLSRMAEIRCIYTVERVQEVLVALI